MRIKRLLAGLGASLLLALGIPMAAYAATTTVTPSNPQGWIFNGDPTTATPYEFSEAEFSTGEGSLYVNPIGDTNPRDKFIAALPLGIPVADLDSVSYDFLIAGDGTVVDANQFYLNVYTNLPGSTTFYDCRFDYVPTAGSTTDFTTATFDATATPTAIAGANCPATLAEMVAGSTVKFIAVNVGDTSTNDTGLAGYLDNVIVNINGDSNAYDFEQNPVTLTTKEACKNNGWKTSEAPIFKNQGDCVSSFASNNKAGGNPAPANKPQF